MPRKKAKTKQWWTTAYFNREGDVYEGAHSFVQSYKSEEVLLEDLKHGMKNFYGPRGVFAVMAWSGQLSRHDALRTTPPRFTVLSDGELLSNR